jgi:hypothetical protein
MRAAILLIAALTGCGERTAEPRSVDHALNATVPANQVNVATKLNRRPSEHHSVEEENDLYSFSFSWPGSIPQQLESRFKDEEKKLKAELVAGAKEERAEREKQGFDYHPHAASRSYEYSGWSGRLMSLMSTSYGFTGGAHGSTGSGAILWDKVLDREISIQDLLLPGTSWTGAIRQPFCVLLDREREKRRGERVKKDDLFGNCPEYKEITVLLSDSDKDARFDHVDVIADQYVAGSYAEGPYEISLPITAAMIERLKPEYRGSFKAQPPVK